MLIPLLLLVKLIKCSQQHLSIRRTLNVRRNGVERRKQIKKGSIKTDAERLKTRSPTERVAEKCVTLT